jgi:hypothetical protein
MTYADCSDTTVVRASARGALFVALKPGVAYDPNRGSYVADGEAITAEDLAESTLPPYRIRILGVYDDATGAPIAGAEIVDAATGTYATTTATGTVSLAYLPDGVSVVRIRKSGYAELKLDVTISANDTTPITVVLKQP